MIQYSTRLRHVGERDDVDVKQRKAKVETGVMSFGIMVGLALALRGITGAHHGEMVVYRQTLRADLLNKSLENPSEIPYTHPHTLAHTHSIMR